MDTESGVRKAGCYSLVIIHEVLGVGKMIWNYDEGNVAQ